MVADTPFGLTSRDVVLDHSLASEKHKKGKTTNVGLGRSLGALAYATSSPLASHKRCVERVLCNRLGAH